MYMWSVFVRIQTVCAGYFYPTGDEPKVTRDVGPNITGSIDGNGWPESGLTLVCEGAFFATKNGSTQGRGGGNRNKIFEMDASLCSNTYGASSTVQPSSLRVLVCIKS